MARPLELDIPIYLTSMSFGALGTNAKMALGKGFSAAGSATVHGRGRHAARGARQLHQLIYQMTPSRYGLDLEHLRMADAIEIAIGQGAKPGTGGPAAGDEGVREGGAHAHAADRASTSARRVRHPDFLGADDLQVKIEELREATDYQVPIFLKLAACRIEQDVKIAAKTGCDAILRGRHGGRHRGGARVPARQLRHPD